MSKVAFYWASASFAKQGVVSTDRGIIDKVDNKPHKVIFDDDEYKNIMMKFNELHQKEWQECIYIVDVEVIKIQDVPRYYKILNVYEEDTQPFDE